MKRFKTAWHFHSKTNLIDLTSCRGLHHYTKRSKHFFMSISKTKVSVTHSQRAGEHNLLYITYIDTWHVDHNAEKAWNMDSVSPELNVFGIAIGEYRNGFAQWRTYRAFCPCHTEFTRAEKMSGERPAWHQQ